MAPAAHAPAFRKMASPNVIVLFSIARIAENPPSYLWITMIVAIRAMTKKNGIATQLTLAITFMPRIALTIMIAHTTPEITGV